MSHEEEAEILVINRDIKSGEEISHNGSIQIEGNIGNYSSILSQNGFIEINGEIGKDVKIDAYLDVSTKSVGNKTSIQSRRSWIAIDGDIGNKVKIEARSFITAKNVGEETELLSYNSKIAVVKVGSGLVLQSDKKIIADAIGDYSSISHLQVK